MGDNISGHDSAKREFRLRGKDMSSLETFADAACSFALALGVPPFPALTVIYSRPGAARRRRIGGGDSGATHD